MFFHITLSMHLTGVYTSNEIAALSDQVVVRYPFEEKDFFAMKLTGFPPHVAHLAAIEQMRGDFLRLGPSLLSDFEKMLNDRTYADVISKNRMEAIMEKIIWQKLLGLTERLKHQTTQQLQTTRNHPPICFCILMMDCSGEFELDGSSRFVL